MGFFSALFGTNGISNTTTNMGKPLGLARCLQLCNIHDNWGGYKMSVSEIMGSMAPAGMEMYEVHRGPSCVRGGTGDYVICRGVYFAEVWSNGGFTVEPRVVQFEDFGDGGCPGFSRLGVFEHVEGDLYRISKPFSIYKDRSPVMVTPELNWNKKSNKFAYREIYTPCEK